MSQPASDDTMSQTSVTGSITDAVYDAYATDSVAAKYAVLQVDAATFAKKVFTCHSCAETETKTSAVTCDAVSQLAVSTVSTVKSKVEQWLDTRPLEQRERDTEKVQARLAKRARFTVDVAVEPLPKLTVLQLLILKLFVEVVVVLDDVLRKLKLS